MTTTTKIDKRPGKVNFGYRRGDTVAEPVTILEGGVAADITGRVYRAQLRTDADADVFVAFTVDIVDAAAGQIVLRLDHDITKGLSGPYAWDLEQDTSGVIRTLLAGTWTFDPDVTRTTG